MQYCDEIDSFISVTNMIHTNEHFLSMTRGYVCDIKLRLSIFEFYFKLNLPDLFEHFQCFEIETVFYLPDWLLSCYVRVLSFKVASRVIDYFLLDGEVSYFNSNSFF